MTIPVNVKAVVRRLLFSIGRENEADAFISGLSAGGVTVVSTADYTAMRTTLRDIANDRGRCRTCGRDAIGEGAGYVHCDDEKKVCVWWPVDPAERARAALAKAEGKP